MGRSEEERITDGDMESERGLKDEFKQQKRKEKGKSKIYD
jgi:hypothetical protein